MKNYKRVTVISYYNDKIYEEIDDFMSHPIRKEELESADELCKELFANTNIDYKLEFEPKISNNTLLDYVEITCEIYVCVPPEFEEKARNIIDNYFAQAEIVEIPPELAEAENE